jgi:hypothetical protein
MFGHKTINEKIVGGTECTPNEFPYQVTIQFGGFHICGGSIIGFVSVFLFLYISV